MNMNVTPFSSPSKTGIWQTMVCPLRLSVAKQETSSRWPCSTSCPPGYPCWASVLSLRRSCRPWTQRCCPPHPCSRKTYTKEPWGSRCITGLFSRTGTASFFIPTFIFRRPRRGSCSGWSVAACWWWAWQGWAWPLVTTVCSLSGYWVVTSSSVSYSHSSSVCSMLASLTVMVWLLGMRWRCCSVFSAASQHSASQLCSCTHGRGKGMGWSYSTFPSGPLPWFVLWYALSGYQSWWNSSSITKYFPSPGTLCRQFMEINVAKESHMCAPWKHNFNMNIIPLKRIFLLQP